MMKMRSWRDQQLSLFEAPGDDKKFTLNSVCTIHNKQKKVLRARTIDNQVNKHPSDVEMAELEPNRLAIMPKPQIPPISKVNRFKEKKLDNYQTSTNEYLTSDFSNQPKFNGVNQGHTFKPLAGADDYDEKFMNNPKLLA